MSDYARQSKAKKTVPEPSPDDDAGLERSERSVSEVLDELLAMLKSGQPLSPTGGAGTSSMKPTEPVSADTSRAVPTDHAPVAPQLDPDALLNLDKVCIRLPELIKQLEDMPYARGQMDKAILREFGRPLEGDERWAFLVPAAIAVSVWLAGKMVDDDREETERVIPGFSILVDPVTLPYLENMNSRGERFLPAVAAGVIYWGGVLGAGAAIGSTAKKIYNKW